MQPLDVSDLSLLHSAALGDDRAFHELVDRHVRCLHRLAMTLTHNAADAEDVLQEALLGAFRGLTRFRERSSVKTWLMQIVSRQAAKSWRKSKNRRQTRSLIGPVSGELLDDPALATAPVDRLDAKMDVMQALQTLPQPFREVLVLRELNGLSYDEIADVLGVARGTVDSRLSRARCALRERLIQLGYPVTDKGGAGDARPLVTSERES